MGPGGCLEYTPGMRLGPWGGVPAAVEMPAPAIMAMPGLSNPRCSRQAKLDQLLSITMQHKPAVCRTAEMHT